MTFVPRLICGQCGTEMQMDEMGVRLEVLARFGSYYKVRCDRWKCVGCGDSVFNIGDTEPYAHHFQPDYADREVDQVVRLAEAR